MNGKTVRKEDVSNLISIRTLPSHLADLKMLGTKMYAGVNVWVWYRLFIFFLKISNVPKVRKVSQYSLMTAAVTFRWA